MLDSYVKSDYKTADKRSTAGEQANNKCDSACSFCVRCA